MCTFETTAVVTPEHTVTVIVPADIPPGPCRVVVVMEPVSSSTTERPFPFNLQMIDIGPWPEGFTVSREQIYGDDDR